MFKGSVFKSRVWVINCEAVRGEAIRTHSASAAAPSRPTLQVYREIEKESLSPAPPRWYDRLPHPVVMLALILVAVAALSYVLPAGEFERVEVDGRLRVVPGSYHRVEPHPVTLLELLRALPLGFAAASPVVYVILASGIMFGALERTRAVENGVGALVRRVGAGGRARVVVGMTFAYGLLGVVVGYENNIAMVPIAAVLALAIGGDLVLAAGLSVGAITVGFGVSPFNPYTVNIGHQLAGLPIFSGWVLRAGLCLTALGALAYWNLRYYRRLAAGRPGLGEGLDEEGLRLSRPLAEYRLGRRDALVLAVFVAGLAVMLWGVFTRGWFLDEISAVFVATAIVAGLAGGLTPNGLAAEALRSVAVVAPGAFLVGLANATRVVMETGRIGDTITHGLASGLEGAPRALAAVGMAAAQSLINFLIPSGSGQALATLPVMLPVGDLLGLTRQVTVLAFQLGDGITNLANPTLGGLVAMLAMCRVPFDRWLRFILPFVGGLAAVGLAVLLGAVYLGYA